MNITNRHVGRRLSRYLDDELPATERQAVDVHLGRCRSCAEELEMLRAHRSLWRAAPRPASTPEDRAAVIAAAGPLLAAAERAARRTATEAGRSRWGPARTPGGINCADLVSAGALAASLVLVVVLVRGARQETTCRPRSATVRTLAEQAAREAGRPLPFDGAWVMPGPFQQHVQPSGQRRSR